MVQDSADKRREQDQQERQQAENREVSEAKGTAENGTDSDALHGQRQPADKHDPAGSKATLARLTTARVRAARSPISCERCGLP